MNLFDFQNSSRKRAYCSKVLRRQLGAFPVPVIVANVTLNVDYSYNKGSTHIDIHYDS